MSAPGPDLQSVDQLVARLRSEIDRHKAARIARRGRKIPNDALPEGLSSPEFSPLALPLFPPLPRKDSYHASELLAYEDRDFVRAVFQALVRREPDLDGGMNALAALRSGAIAKVALIDGVHNSPEAKAIGVRLSGVALRMKIRRLRTVPLIGKILAAIVSLPQLPTALDDLHRISGRAAKIDRTLAAVQAAMGERLNALTLANVRSENLGAQLADQVTTLERRLADQAGGLGQQLAAQAHSQQMTEQRLPPLTDAIAQLRRELDFIREPTQSPFVRLEQTLAAISPAEPIYRLPGAHAAARAPADLLALVDQALAPHGHRLRMVLFNIGAGYAPFHLAEKGATVTGFDPEERMIAAALALRNVNRLPADFRQGTLAAAAVSDLSPAQFDAALILRGFELADAPAALLGQLLERVPLVLLTLPDGIAPPAPPAGASCNAAGHYPHGAETRALYLCAAEVIRVNNVTYPVRHRAFTAYADAPSFCRHYIQSDGVFIKYYLAVGGGAQGDFWYGNLPQILREIVNYNMLTEPCPAIPRLLDYQLTERNIALVLEQTPGVNLSAALADHTPLLVRPVYLAVVSALRHLRGVGLFHNDVRPWNVMVDHDRAWLIDLGLAAPKEDDSTIVGLLWLLHDLGRGELSRYPKPLLDPPSRAIHDYHPDLQDAAAALLEAPTFDAYLAATELAPA